MRLLSIPKAARSIDCGISTLRSMARAGALPTVRVGQRPKISEAELRRWITNGGAKERGVGTEMK
jgi:excisionase family DNA binding protein